MYKPCNYFAISSNLSEAKRKKSISVSVINLAVGEKFSSFSLRRKSSSFLDVSGKENIEINDDSSNESEEEKDSFSNPPTPPTPPKRISSLKPKVNVGNFVTKNINKSILS